jgi:hypothetical protein
MAILCRLCFWCLLPTVWFSSTAKAATVAETPCLPIMVFVPTWKAATGDALLEKCENGPLPASSHRIVLCPKTVATESRREKNPFAAFHFHPLTFLVV